MSAPATSKIASPKAVPDTAVKKNMPVKSIEPVISAPKETSPLVESKPVQPIVTTTTTDVKLELPQSEIITAEKNVEQSIPAAIVAATESDKKMSRAQRFGIVTNPKEIADMAAKSTSNGDTDTLKKRAEKFGIISPVLVAQEAAKEKEAQVSTNIFSLRYTYQLFLY